MLLIIYNSGVINNLEIILLFAPTNGYILPFASKKGKDFQSSYPFFSLVCP